MATTWTYYDETRPFHGALAVLGAPMLSNARLADFQSTPELFQLATSMLRHLDRQEFRPDPGANSQDHLWTGNASSAAGW